jgi:hypothetical protein
VASIKPDILTIRKAIVVLGVGLGAILGARLAVTEA